MAMTIETFFDLKTLSIKEITGRFLVVEERGKLKEFTKVLSNLFFNEEEWIHRLRQLERGGGLSNTTH